MIGIAIGHSRKGDSGAWHVGSPSQSEWAFNSELVPLILPKLKVPYEVYDDYKASSYVGAMSYVSRCMRQDKIQACIELHFNFASPQATGHEWLYWETSKGGKRLATSLRVEMEKAYPELRSRGSKPRGKGQRGAGFLRATPCYACIAEPFMGSSAKDLSIIQSDLNKLATVYANGINGFFDT
tara:strand:+ start:254 stop:802 length:549 start_codon:yes stop_codon:yes gene_type:complete